MNRPFPSYLVPLFQNLSYENEFDLLENKPVEGRHFHMNGFAWRLVLRQRQKATRKWPDDETFLLDGLLKIVMKGQTSSPLISNNKFS